MHANVGFRQTGLNLLLLSLSVADLCERQNPCTRSALHFITSSMYFIHLLLFTPTIALAYTYIFQKCLPN